VPDGDRWLFGLGASYAPSERLAFDVGAAYVTFRNSTIDSRADAFAGTPLATPVALRGEVEGRGLVLSAGVRMGF
jgi:long-chain fatty acid transport protein